MEHELDEELDKLGVKTNVSASIGSNDCLKTQLGEPGTSHSITWIARWLSSSRHRKGWGKRRNSQTQVYESLEDIDGKCRLQQSIQTGGEQFCNWSRRLFNTQNKIVVYTLTAHKTNFNAGIFGWLVHLVGKCFHLKMISHYGVDYHLVKSCRCLWRDRLNMWPLNNKHVWLDGC